MAIWHRINQSKLKFLSHQFKSCYVQNPSYTSSRDYIAKSSSSPVLENQFSFFCKRPADFSSGLRFFGAPIRFRAEAKKEEEDTSGPRLNEQIRAQYVRVVTDQGHNVVLLHEALERAGKLKLDLVEVQRNANPPVCKIMDFRKEKYKQERMKKDRAKSKLGVTVRDGDCKEVRFAGKTEHKDLKTKADTVIRLMERGYRVKCMATVCPKKGSGKASLKKGSGNEDPKMGPGDEEYVSKRKKEDEEEEDLGVLLSRLTALIEHVSIVESGPRVERQQAYVIVRHVKFGPSRKGGAKKLMGVQKVTTAPPTACQPAYIKSPAVFKENPAESGLESEDQVLSDEDDLPDQNLEGDKTAWSVTDSTDDFHRVFNFNDDAKGPSINPTEEINSVPETAPSNLNFNVPNFSHPRPALDSKKADRLTSAQLEPFLATENRYKRSEQRNQFPPTTSVDNRGPHKRDTFRFEPQFSNQRMQPESEISVSCSMGGRKQVGTDSSAFRKVPREMPMQEVSPPDGLNTSTSNYGIFSSPKASAPGKQVFAAEVINKEGNAYDSARNSKKGGFGPNPNYSSSRSEGGQRLGIDRDGHGGWGLFSRDGPNVNLNRISKSN